MKGAPGRADRHVSHVYTADYCDGKYCAGCNAFIGSLLPSIAEPCAMDRRAVVVEAAETFDWLGSLRSAG